MAKDLHNTEILHKYVTDCSCIINWISAVMHAFFLIIRISQFLLLLL